MLQSDVKDPFNQTQKPPTDLDLTGLWVNNWKENQQNSNVK